MAACTPRNDALRLAAPRFRRGALLVCAAAALVLPASPQTRKGQTIGSGQTVRHHREQISGGVNPAVDHPRWSQAKERRIGDFFKRPTLPFNGYASQVASLYTGMDLRRFF